MPVHASKKTTWGIMRKERKKGRQSKEHTAFKICVAVVSTGKISERTYLSVHTHCSNFWTK